MFHPDHIMIETKTPLEDATNFSERFDLPFAWPLIDKSEYSSIGINVGTINFEFIHFNTRFGVQGQSFSGLSGIAFTTNDSEEDSIDTLIDLGLKCRVGEKTEAHTTITVEEDRVFPTVFLVRYHFDTREWRARLCKDFLECGGGRFGIKKLGSIILGQELPSKLVNEFGITENKSEHKNQIVFEVFRGDDETVVISDLVENLEIVLV